MDNLNASGRYLEALRDLRNTLGEDAAVLIPDLIETFYEEAPKLIEKSTEALREGRYNDLRRSAHTLKSGSTTFGATALQRIAQELENLARDGVCTGAAELIERAEAEFPRAKSALESVRNDF